MKNKQDNMTIREKTVITLLTECLQMAKQCETQNINIENTIDKTQIIEMKLSLKELLK